jgi:hypothetical protein
MAPAGNALKIRLLRGAYGGRCERIPWGKGLIRQGACVDFWNALNMPPLSLNDDSQTRRTTGRRHREEGVATRATKFLIRKKTVQLFESVSFE